MNNAYIIAELCGQWGGSMFRAKEMISQCAKGGADAVKVQLWDTYRMPGENREKWEYLSVSKDQFIELKNHADNLAIDFFASVFHEDRFEWVRECGIKINKIASMLPNHNYKLCEKMIKTGMTTYCSLGRWEKDKPPFIKYPNVKYFHCVSKYPHSPEEAIELMPREFSESLIGYSDHTTNIEACKESIRRGAKVIEKHFTLDYNLQCETESAHVCSMDFDQLKKLRGFCDTFALC